MSIDTHEATAGSAEETYGNENKFLSFKLGAEEYGVEILSVREIIGLLDITPLPQTPDYVKGVVNLRGKIIPVINLRTRFGLETVSYTDQTCIVVVEVTSAFDDESYHIGVIVDTVSEVLDITQSQIEPPPEFGNSVNADYVKGMGKLEHRVVILLDINKVLSHSEMESINSAADQSADAVVESVPTEIAI